MGERAELAMDDRVPENLLQITESTTLSAKKIAGSVSQIHTHVLGQSSSD